MESLTLTEKKFPRFTVTSSCKSVRHSNDPLFKNTTNFLQGSLTNKCFGNSTEYLPIKLPEFPPNKLDLWKDTVDITSNATNNVNTLPKNENVSQSDRPINKTHAPCSSTTLCNEHDLDFSTVRTSGRTDIHRKGIPHECIGNERILQDNVCEEPSSRRPNTLHLDPCCDGSKSARCCNGNGLPNTESPKVSPRTKYIVNNGNQHSSNDAHTKDDRILRMQTVLEELTHKMCKFCVENSSIFANLEESLRIVTHLKSIIQNSSVKENCKHGKILQFVSSSWDRIPESVSQSDSCKQGTFDGVVRGRSTNSPQPDNIFVYSDFDCIHSDILKPSEPQLKVSEFAQNMAWIAGDQPNNGSATPIMVDEKTGSDNPSVLSRNPDMNRQCNSRGSAMKHYFRRTSQSRERAK